MPGSRSCSAAPRVALQPRYDDTKLPLAGRLAKLHLSLPSARVVMAAMTGTLFRQILQRICCRLVRDQFWMANERLAGHPT